ncbi:hypothetical protein VDGE_05895 [Verticillium dahliae]|uniref:Cullin family profile domain-containing protein n=1 Tax=Verticillium dahliae TaxID=27337 RepID=A0A444RZF2_VERDA|nr:hypothetical protein VDGE_05895 [Verticillium dahliae]
MPSNPNHPADGKLPSRATGSVSSGLRTSPSSSAALGDASISSPSRRRPRVDSDVHASPSTPHLVQQNQYLPSSAFSEKPSPKRFKFGADTASMTTMSNKTKGKLPEVIDLTRQSAFRPYSGAKKIVIKNLRPPTQTDKTEQYYDRTRLQLKDALQCILRHQPLQLPMERLYRGAEDICRHGQGQELYRTLQELCEAHLKQATLRSIIDRSPGPSNIDMLRSVFLHWQDWNKAVIDIRSIFSYLDRTYLLRERTLGSINDLTITQFRKMLSSSASKDATNQTPFTRCLHGVCELIAYDRVNDDRFDARLLKESVRMFNVLNVYQKSFEPAFLHDSVNFFHEFADERSTASLKEYILACEKLLKDEDYRCNAYNLDSTTKKQLLDAAHGIVVKDYSAKLLNVESLSKLLADQEIESMRALYDLLRLSGIQAKLKDPWKTYIQEAGATIVGDVERGDDMVMRLLELRRALDLVVRDGFRGDEVFGYELRHAFGAFMNDRKTTSGWSTGTSKIGEMIAKHIDMLLRGGLKALPKSLLSDNKDRAAAEKSGQSSTADEDAELDRQLDAALELFRFIEGKDAFEAFYKKDLARRLLMGRSASEDAERNMLRKLRDECGANFTRNLEQMFKDQELAKEEMQHYKQWSEGTNAEQQVDLQVMVISAASWPTYPDTKLNLPEGAAVEIERFERWYNHKHDGRKLSWPHSLANCTVKAIFPRGTKELLVSAFQAVVLVLFNEVDLEGFLSFGQISTATGLAGPELQRTLQSLACGKVRVLSKHPKGRDVSETDTFTINKAFTDPKLRIKINQIQLKETKEENKATHERIAEDRKFETQAAIVRVMKARKTIGHSELVAEVINFTRKRGPVDAASIKKLIETLIDKDYMERDGNMYTYIS